MKRLFLGNDTELQSLMEQMRQKVIAAIPTIQYECSTLPGQQLGQVLLPEPFSKGQQLTSRLDGGQEEDNTIRGFK